MAVLLMAARSPRAPGDGALSLRGWAAEAEAAAGIAKALAPTAFVPEHLRVYRNPLERNPDKKQLDLDSTVAQVAAVLLAGQELEFGPMASLRAFVIIRGTVALFAVAARALLLRHGHDIIVVESTSIRARVKGLRAGGSQWQESVWDIERAKTAGLFPGHVDGNWRKQTKAMLVARASAEVARWIAADAMLGLPLIAEEVEDADRELPTGDDADQFVATQHPDGEAKARTARRKTPATRAALPAAPPPASPEPTVPVPAEQAPPGPKATKAQLAKLHAGLSDIQITGREEGLGLVSAWAGRRVESTASLTRDEIGIALERLDVIRSAAARDTQEDRPPGEPPSEAPEDPPPGDQEGPPDAEHE